MSGSQQPPEDESQVCDYNPLFETLVEKTEEGTPERIIGMLAYADYKSAKCGWVKEFRAKRGMYPTRQDMQSFIDAYSQPITLKNLRAGAQTTLYEHAEFYTQDRISGIKEDLENDARAQQLATHHDSLKNVVNSHSGPWTAFWIGIGSNFVFTLVLFFLALFGRDQFRDLFEDKSSDNRAAKEVSDSSH